MFAPILVPKVVQWFDPLADLSNCPTEVIGENLCNSGFDPWADSFSPLSPLRPDQLERVHRTNALITEAQVHYSGLILWLIQSVQCPTQSQISWIVRTDLDYQS